MSMPYIDDDIEQEENETLLQNFEIQGKDISLDFSENDIRLADGDAKTIRDKAGLQQWIEKVLKTRAYVYEIYTLDDSEEPYGSQIKEIMLDPEMDYAEKTADIQMEIENALAVHPDILSVSEFTFGRKGRMLTVNFVVTSVYGDEYEEVTINGEDSE